MFRRTFATRMYEDGVRVKEIAAYIGELEYTTERYYIAVCKKIKDGDKVGQVVMLHGMKCEILVKTCGIWNCEKKMTVSWAELERS